jgi:mannan endo-1,4-beta-mannosidase
VRKALGLLLAALLIVSAYTVARASTNDGIIHTDGLGHLTLNGQIYQFTGVNAYELATDWSINYGCGSDPGTTIDQMFQMLRPNDVVRFWAFEQLGYNNKTNQIDFTGIDRVVQAAERQHIRLILTLGNEWADCDGLLNGTNSGIPKDDPWYQSGYKTTPPPGLPLTYRQWVQRVVKRYKSSPAVGMWEPMNEAQGGWDSAINNCAANGPGILQSFFDDIGGLIHTLDPHHLVEAGVMGGNQCGLNSTNYVTVMSSAGIDVTTYHDYGDSSPVPAELSYRISQSAQLHKPIIVGEVGYLSDCPLMQAKQPAQFVAGVSGFLPWNWDNSSESTCGL